MVKQKSLFQKALKGERSGVRTRVNEWREEWKKRSEVTCEWVWTNGVKSEKNAAKWETVEWSEQRSA